MFAVLRIRSNAYLFSKSNTLTRHPFKDVDKCNTVIASHFHSGAIVLGRKTGSSAFDVKFRSPSKKQIRRRSRRLQRDVERSRADPKAQQMRRQHFTEQLQHPDTMKFIQNLTEQMEKPIHDMMLPAAANQGNPDMIDVSGVKEMHARTSPIRINVKRVMKELRQLQSSPSDAETAPPVSSVKYSNSEPMSKSVATHNKVTISIHNSTIKNDCEERIHSNANFALLKLSSTKESLSDCETALELVELMQDLKIPIWAHVLPSVISVATRAGKYDVADKLFDEAILSESDDQRRHSKLSDVLEKSAQFPLSPDHFESFTRDLAESGPSLETPERLNMVTWTSKVNNLVKQQKFDQALSVMENLKRAGLVPVPAMYTVILKGYLDAHRLSDVKQFWGQMHVDGVEIDLNAFQVMLRYCSVTGQAERSFFLIDEMRTAYGLLPDERTFYQLILAAGKAPHFVPGYEDTILDALAIIEGQEMAPSALHYIALIESFSDARDPEAAEYYYWEMRRKNLLPNLQAINNSMKDNAEHAEDIIVFLRTYKSLFAAYASAQSVGAKNYGNYGRFSKAPPPKPTPDQQDRLDIGPERVSELLASDLEVDIDYEDGKRSSLRPKWTDADEENYAMDLIRFEAAEARAEREKSSSKEGSNKVDERYKASSKSSQYNSLLAELKQDPILHEFFGETESCTKASSGDSLPEEILDNDNNGAMIPDNGLVHNNTTSTLEQARSKLRDTTSSQYSDPFGELPDVKGLLCQKIPQMQLQKPTGGHVPNSEAVKRIAQLLDGDASQPSQTASGSRHISAMEESNCQESGLDEIDAWWDYVHFGRPPAADYSAPLNVRRKVNCHRARLAFDEMLKQLVNFGSQNQRNKPSDKTLSTRNNIFQAALSNYLAVFTEAQHTEKALVILKDLEKNHGFRFDSHALRHLIKMHVRNKDVDAAMTLYRSMCVPVSSNSIKASGERNLNHAVVADAETFGYLISTTTKRGMLVEALKLLEHAASVGAKLPNRHIRELRAHCSSMGIVHPDMPDDPTAWVKEAAQIRRNRKHTSQRKLGRVISASYARK